MGHKQRTVGALLGNFNLTAMRKTGKTMSYRIVIADDHQIVRQGLRDPFRKGG